MKILADYHHSDLFESLALLFEDRLGWELYRPYGMAWFDEMIWNHEREHHGDAVARQYLGEWSGDEAKADWTEREDRTHPGRTYKMVTLEQARSQSWDVVLSSLPDNDVGLFTLARERGAKFGIQLGNVGQQSNWNLADFGLCSTTLPYDPGVPHVIYRQEFSLADFRYEPPPRRDPFGVSSFVQCFPENSDSYAQFLRYAERDASFDWRVFGAYGGHPTDAYACGNLPSTPRVAEAMRGTDVIWHAKEWSDGYGHVIHNAFAVGRPVFGVEGYYTDKLAGPLWVDGVTSIDINRHDPIEELQRLRDDPEKHQVMCEAAAARFREIVDFDEDEANVRALLARVLSDRLVAA